MAKRIETAEIVREIQDASSVEAGATLNPALLRRSCPHCARELLRRPTQWVAAWECPACRRLYVEMAPLMPLDPADYRPSAAAPETPIRPAPENRSKPAGRARTNGV